MNHPNEDQLLLLAYGELSERDNAEVESHIAGCASCARQLAQLDRGRAALDLALPPPSRSARPRRAIIWTTGILAAAAVLALVLLKRPDDRGTRGWLPTTTWSTTAGYIAGGPAVRDIDEKLTRLEQEWPYGRP